MFFGFTEEEKMVKKSVSDMLKKYCETDHVRKFIEDNEIPPKIKELFSQQGLLGIIEQNGKGIDGIIHGITVAHEAGRALLPYPLLENLIGLYALKSCNNQSVLIRDVEDGKQILTIAWNNENLRIRKEEGCLISGKLSNVAFAVDATKIITSIKINNKDESFNQEQEETLVVINREHPSINLKKLPAFDETYPLYEVTLFDYPLNSTDILGVGSELIAKMKQLGSLLISSEMVGAAEKALYETVEYTKQRKQFDVVIAKFQALKHMAADMYVVVESAKAAVEYAAWALQTGDSESDLAVSIAKSYTSKAAKKVTGDAIQMQGGIGFTWENDLHLYFKRATRAASQLGDVYSHNENIIKNIVDGITETISQESEKEYVQ